MTLHLSLKVPETGKYCRLPVSACILVVCLHFDVTRNGETNVMLGLITIAVPDSTEGHKLEDARI